MQPNWEYQILHLDIEHPLVQEKLNELGSEGWELVSYPDGTSAVFKRRQLALTNLWSENKSINA